MNEQTLIAAMEAAGYWFDSFESNDMNQRFVGEYGNVVWFNGWDDVEDWLMNVVFDDLEIANNVERIMRRGF